MLRCTRFASVLFCVVTTPDEVDDLYERRLGDPSQQTDEGSFLETLERPEPPMHEPGWFE